MKTTLSLIDRLLQRFPRGNAAICKRIDKIADEFVLSGDSAAYVVLMNLRNAYANDFQNEFAAHACSFQKPDISITAPHAEAPEKEGRIN